MIRSSRNSARSNSIRFKIRKSRHTILLITLLGSTLLLPSFALCMVARNDPGVAIQPQEKTGPRKQEPKLPWERSQQHRIPNLTRPTEKELLVDITEEQRLKIKEHSSIESEARLLAQLIFRIERFGLDNLFHLAEKNQSEFDKLTSEPGFQRLKVFEFSGKAVGWEKKQLNAELAELFDMPHYYRIKTQLKSGQYAIIYCRQIPRKWLAEKKVSEDIHGRGLFVNLTRSTDGPEILNFVAHRIRWVPASKSKLISEKGHALLGSAGFDLSLLEGLKRQNNLMLDAGDTEAFFQMLSAARLIDHSKDPPDWSTQLPKFDLLQTLQAPHEKHGEMRLLNIEVRNVTLIRVDNEYVRERININEYYQLDGFLKINSKVSYKTKDGKKGAVFTKKYPVSVCINQLPEGWKAGSNQRYNATFPVFFYRIWAYPSEFQDTFSEEAMQYSPLFVAIEPVQYTRQVSGVNWYTLGLFVLVGIGVISVWTNFFIKRAKKDRSAIQFQLPSKVDIEAPEKKEPSKAPVEGMPVIVVDDEDSNDK